MYEGHLDVVDADLADYFPSIHTQNSCARSRDASWTRVYCI